MQSKSIDSGEPAGNDNAINSVDDFLSQIENFPKEKYDIPEASRRLLKKVYNAALNMPEGVLKDDLNSLPPPLIISFHPKASLLNNNIHETYLAEKIAAKLGFLPIWIPYIYDTGYKTAANKIRLPTYVFFEGKFIPLRAASKVRGNIMATEKPITEKEIKNFFKELFKLESMQITTLKNMLNPFNFGHHLFDLKKEVSRWNKKYIKKRIDELERIWLNSVKGTKRLSDSLAKISLENLKLLGINVALLFIDDLLADLVHDIFSEVLKTKGVIEDPALLENLFLSYNLKTKERSPILYTGDNKFIAFDEYDVKTFDGTFKDLVEGIKTHKVLPTGHLIMTIFTAIGCKLVLGGSHTVNYYPDYFKKAYSVLKETPFNAEMQLLSYGDLRFMDLRNINDLLSVIRILDKVGSRNYIQKGSVKIPRDIVDHLNFLAGKKAIPKEYIPHLEQILSENQNQNQNQNKNKNQNQNKNKDNKEITALQKEEIRYSNILKLFEKQPQDLLNEPGLIKKWINVKDLSALHPVRLEVMLENLRLDAQLRLLKLKDNIKYEQHILGGTLTSYEHEQIENNKTDMDNDSDEETSNERVLYDGILLRSNRYPTLFELVFYRYKDFKNFNVSSKLKFPLKLMAPPDKWIWKMFATTIDEKDIIKVENEFKEYKKLFDFLLPKEYLIKF
ncbi:MAG: hypothetical protein ACTSU2_14405 [Promethearchaeota archaeon]